MKYELDNRNSVSDTINRNANTEKEERLFRSPNGDLARLHLDLKRTDSLVLPDKGDKAYPLYPPGGVYDGDLPIDLTNQYQFNAVKKAAEEKAMAELSPDEQRKVREQRAKYLTGIPNPTAIGITNPVSSSKGKELTQFEARVEEIEKHARDRAFKKLSPEEQQELLYQSRRKGDSQAEIDFEKKVEEEVRRPTPEVRSDISRGVLGLEKSEQHIDASVAKQHAILPPKDRLG